MEDGGSGSGSVTELESMMEELGLSEENLQDVEVEDDDLPKETTRWMATPRVHTNKTYSQYWFYRQMRTLWDLAQEVKVRPLEDNLYTMQFQCLGDWERVMQEGPWQHKGKAMVIAPTTVSLGRRR
ncbi:hypothetical protein ZWY2020_039535 [Hordeum vulgare]|nr:hypothetical protein ZWY2020_039535 [Hordeum vulgare]